MTRLLTILQRHRGKDRAITGKRIAAMLGFQDDRAIRQEIRQLISQGIPIASATQPPYGYYIIESPQEAEHYMSQLKSRLVQDAYRRRDFKKASMNALSEEKQLALL